MYQCVCLFSVTMTPPTWYLIHSVRVFAFFLTLFAKDERRQAKRERDEKKNKSMICVACVIFFAYFKNNKATDELSKRDWWIFAVSSTSIVCSNARRVVECVLFCALGNSAQQETALADWGNTPTGERERDGGNRIRMKRRKKHTLTHTVECAWRMKWNEHMCTYKFKGV